MTNPTAEDRADMLVYAKKGGFHGLVSMRRLIEHVEELLRDNKKLRKALEGWVKHVDRWHGPDNSAGVRCDNCLGFEAFAREALKGDQ